MKNNKGITTIELIVSISLIAVILLFLFKVIVDVRYEKNATYARKNNVVRTEIINAIQRDFVRYGVSNISKNGNIYTITFLDISQPNKDLIVNNTTVEYDGNLWTFIEGEIKLNNLQEPIKVAGGSSGRYYIMLTIPIKFKENENNKMDDIELFYIKT